MRDQLLRDYGIVIDDALREWHIESGVSAGLSTRGCSDRNRLSENQREASDSGEAGLREDGRYESRRRSTTDGEGEEEGDDGRNGERMVAVELMCGTLPNPSVA